MRNQDIYGYHNRQTSRGSGRRTRRQRATEAVRNFGREVSDNPILTFISWLMLLGLLVALVKVASINIAPYYLLMSYDDGSGWVSQLPLIGNVLKAWDGAVNSIGAILIWALTQSLQILWILIGLDRKAHANALKESAKFEFGSFSNADSAEWDSDRYTRRMARKSRRIPFFFVRWSLLLGLSAYVADLVVGLRIYPPADSLRSIGRALSIGTTNGLNGDNLVQLAIMLFSFEAIAIPAIVVGQWVWTRNRE